MYCHKCGNKLDENAKFCNMCGAKQTVSPDINSIADKTNIKSGTTAKKKTSIIFVILAVAVAITVIGIFVLNELSGIVILF